METQPREGVVKEKFPNIRKPSHQQFCGGWGRGGISEGNITRRKKINHRIRALPEFRARNSPDTHACHQQVGAEQGGGGYMLRVRTGPECPEDNLRELTWDSNPNFGLARERERENFPVRSSNLRYSLAYSQNKGLSEYQRRASWLRTGSPPYQRQIGWQSTARARRWGAISAPEMASSTKQGRLPVSNQVFLGSWKADICQEGHSLRSSPQKRHKAHMRRCSHLVPWKTNSWDAGRWLGCTALLGQCAHQAPGHLSSLDLRRA